MTIKTVGVKKLKDNLSSYLKDANSGTIILVTDRDRVIAEIHEPVMDVRAHAENSILADWIREGKILPPKTGKTDCPPSPLNTRHGTARAMLDMERDE